MPTSVAPLFLEDDLRAVAKALQNAATHAELPSLFRDCHLSEPEPVEGMPKWSRIFNALAQAQNRTGTGNFVMKFISTALSPRRFVADPAKHEELREAINRILAFRGCQLLDDGRFQRTSCVSTIDEARARANRLRSELERRGVHADVLEFCRAELLQENYFHAVLEATKSLSAKIREKSGLTTDAAELAMSAFGLGKADIPYLAFNSLQTETHKSEQRGLMNLFVGMFGTFRNVTAHGEKLTWDVTEQDALDLLTLVSMLHRRLDDSIRTARTAE